MDASVDANIFIHLYKAKLKELLFTSFDHLYAFEYILDEEIRNNNQEVYKEVSEDILAGRLIKIGFADLIEKGIKTLFENEYQENLKLFAYDRGEAYAVALSTVLGIEALVTDDTKMGGPHETLLKEYIEDVMPFCFYEILFLKYLKAELTCEELQGNFEHISNHFTRPMNFQSKIKSVLRRFNKHYGTERDLVWIQEFCAENNVDLREKVVQIADFLRS